MIIIFDAMTWVNYRLHMYEWPKHVILRSALEQLLEWNSQAQSFISVPKRTPILISSLSIEQTAPAKFNRKENCQQVRHWIFSSSVWSPVGNEFLSFFLGFVLLVFSFGLLRWLLIVTSYLHCWFSIWRNTVLRTIDEWPNLFLVRYDKIWWSGCVFFMFNSMFWCLAFLFS